MTAAPQPKETSADDSRQALVFGIYDRLLGHEHCSPDVVLAPAKADGEPDWDNAGPANLEALPADEWPEDPQQAKRAAVIVDHLDGCAADTSMLVFLREDGEPSMIQIAGSDLDGDIAMRIIGRDIGAKPPQRKPSPLAESLAKLSADLFPPKSAPVAANDNVPDKLASLRKRHGGTITNGILRGALIDGVARDVKIIDGEPWLLTPAGSPFAKLPPASPELPIVNPSDWHGKPLPVRQWYAEGLIRCGKSPSSMATVASASPFCPCRSQQQAPWASTP